MTAESAKQQENFRFGAKDAGILLALLLVAAAALWPILRAPPSLAPGLPGQDGRTQWYPWRAYAAHAIRGGALPLWNPYVLCGTPFLGDFQSAVLYPPNLIFAVAPIGVAARASVLFHVWLSMIFAYLLARMCGCGRCGGSVGAMAFGLCAAQLLRVPAGHWGVSCAIPWIALIFLCTEWTMRRPSRAALLAGAFAVAMQILSGLPQYVFISTVSACFYALIRPIGPGFAAREPGGELWKGRLARWGAVAGMWLLGAALAAAQLLPGIEAALRGARSLPMAKAWLATFSLGPECLLTLFVPGLFGGTNLEMHLYWGRWLSWEMNAYIGIAVLALALYALVSERPRRLVACFAATAFLALLLALGRHAHVTELLALTPLGGLFRGSAKFLLPFSLALSMLAAIGADRLLSDPLPKLRRLILCAGIPAAVALAIALLAPAHIGAWQNALQRSGECLPAAVPITAPPGCASAVRDGLQALVLLAGLVGGFMLFRRQRNAAAFLIFFIVAADGVLFGREFISPATAFRAEGTAWPAGAGAFLRDLGGGERTLALGIPEMNDAMIERVPVIEGTEPDPPARFHQLFQSGQGRPVTVAPSVYQLNPQAGWPLALRMAVGRVLAPAGTSERGVLWQGAGSEIIGLTSPVPRAQVVYRAEFAASPDMALKSALSTDPRVAVILEEKSAPPPSSVAPSAGTFAAILEDLPERVVVRAELEAPGWLVLRDNFFPGWKAEVDGARAKILRADYAFRAVALSAGKHRVAFYYRPDSLYWGIGVSLAALTAAAGIALSTRRKQRAAPSN